LIEKKLAKNPPFIINPRRLKAPKIKTDEKAWTEQMNTVITKLKRTKDKEEAKL
jgi:hypothetical protein